MSSQKLHSLQTNTTSVPRQPGSLEDAPRLLPLRQFALRLGLSLVAIIVGILGFMWLARGVFNNAFRTFDIYGLNVLYQSRTPFMTYVMYGLTTIGSPTSVTIIVTLVTFGLFYFRRWLDGAALATTALLGALLNIVMKDLYQRIRPDLFPGPISLTSYSFPSGHAMGSTICFGMISFVIGRLLPSHFQRTMLNIAAALLVVNVSLSRVYFAVHYPTDVLGGCLAGLIWLAVMTDLLDVAQRIVQRRKARLNNIAVDQA